MIDEDSDSGGTIASDEVLDKEDDAELKGATVVAVIEGSSELDGNIVGVELKDQLEYQPDNELKGDEVDEDNGVAIVDNLESESYEDWSWTAIVEECSWDADSEVVKSDCCWDSAVDGFHEEYPYKEFVVDSIQFNFSLLWELSLADNVWKLKGVVDDIGCSLKLFSCKDDDEGLIASVVVELQGAEFMEVGVVTPSDDEPVFGV